MENEIKNDVTRTIFKLMRAMRRHPLTPAHEFPPTVGRVLMALKKQDSLSQAELCEIMDMRPSSMSELLARVEEKGLISRTGDENDRRATKVSLSDAGRDALDRTFSHYQEENDKLTACFTSDELARFIDLCDKLSAHIETLPAPEGKGACPGRRGPCGPRGHHGPHGPFAGPGHHGHGPVHFGKPEDKADEA